MMRLYALLSDTRPCLNILSTPIPDGRFLSLEGYHSIFGLRTSSFSLSYLTTFPTVQTAGGTPFLPHPIFQFCELNSSLQMIMLRGLLSACIVLAITVLATLQAAYASPILSNLSPTISSLHEHPTWSTSSFSSFTQQLKSAYGHCRSKTQSDPSHPKVLVGYGFTQKFNWDEKTAKDPGYLSDFFLVRPSNPKSDSKGDLVLYQKPILPTRNPHADPKHYLKVSRRLFCVCLLANRTGF
ncbi:hypothetical protein FB446DRAFT_443714 [Lentinula raphanica]|nr:hypothetical protein FB446DRAFT_443714 [Lentinula raphanica]